MPVTADSALWTADSHCVTADGRIVCLEADIHEAAATLDQLDAVKVAAAAVVEATVALDETDAAIGALVLFGTVDETATALDQPDAAVEAAEIPIDGGGGFHPPLQRPLPVYGVGYGILPELWGEAHGVVGVAGKSSAQVLVRAAAIGACGQAGDAAAVLKGLAVAGHGAVGTRGAGEGMIVKFSGTATGNTSDDEAAVIAFLLAA